MRLSVHGVVAALVFASAGLVACGHANAAADADAPALAGIHRVAEFKNLFEFDQARGSAPHSAPVRVSRRDSEVYWGVTRDGGAYGTGALYQLSLAGQMTLVHSFIQDGQDGFWPEASLTRASDGSLWGTTVGGGRHYGGTIFRISRAGVYSVVHSFGDATNDGRYGSSALVEAPDGSMFGTTAFGGQYGQGTIYRITPDGTYSVAYALKGLDGTAPQFGLVRARDGNFYGGTNVGGEHGNGTLFRFERSGRFTRLVSLQGPTTGVYPSRLVEGPDGLLYGAMASSGPAYGGALFRMTLNGDITLMHLFAPTTLESHWPTGLIFASDGNFYGTNAGYNVNAGALFKMSITGHVTILHSFSPASPYFPMDGGTPVSPPVEVHRGLLVGTTSVGGSSPGHGAVYSYTLAPHHWPR
ncbi:hypothetical protein GHT07_03390 [Caenimonas koreensis DSM 17982]|uniref:Gloeo_Verruco repeat-containing protein n=1 Tax=Caenimonas koreensis DSM 17982 TaxID=1121255 RepID=A0A844B441_9BURK|nr:choice-of-anchor tandem repeat GloVer-containing protein [Caenimonas koreensis]MRD46307.1 hypothetical protein [Caenimonas koreensis DSM 17982]